MIDKLKSCPKQSKIALLIRHGDRDKIPEGEYGNEILLNDTGKQKCLRFGEEIRDYKINRILCSPVQRCVETAELIVKGYGKSVEVIQTKSLGDPGLHIVDDKQAGDHFLTHGFTHILAEFVNGKTSPGFKDAESLNKEMTSFIQDNVKEDGVTLFITHDSLITLYQFCKEGKIYSKDNWLNYLDGMVIEIR